MDRFYWEKTITSQGFHPLVGIDEAGRGPLAGPVVAAAVQFPAEWFEKGLPDCLHSLDDSKKLTAKKRQALYNFLTSHQGIRFRISQVESKQIDQINILKATHSAMRNTITAFDGPKVQHALIDGLPVKGLPCTQTAIVKGDTKSFTIAAASIIAKVYRDALMERWDEAYPQYGFAKHKGYATKAHRQAILHHGPCAIHRRSFLTNLQSAQTSFEFESP